MLCPERARREHTGEMEDWETDAAVIGTAVHFAIESTLNLWKEEQRERTLDEVMHVADNHFAMLADRPEFRWVKYKERSANTFLTACVESWYEEVMPDYLMDNPSYMLEVPFQKLFLADFDRVIELAGTIDYLEPYAKVGDWKTASRGPYTPWEYKRWAIQPTIYTWAATAEGYFDTLPVEFEYVVLGKHDPQRLVVERGGEHWSWLADQVTPIAELIEYELPRWPVNDSHALCSEKWCPAWSSCKGKHGIVF